MVELLRRLEKKVLCVIYEHTANLCKRGCERAGGWLALCMLITSGRNLIVLKESFLSLGHKSRLLNMQLELVIFYIKMS